ncbi:MAG: hypothetical protein ABSF91_07865 [Bacteroidota bacterium]|jgi:hypothetical protein
MDSNRLWGIVLIEGFPVERRRGKRRLMSTRVGNGMILLVLITEQLNSEGKIVEGEQEGKKSPTVLPQSSMFPEDDWQRDYR